MFPASSITFRAKWYVVSSSRPDASKVSCVPPEAGAGASGMSVASPQFASVIGSADRRTSYDAATPRNPSSPLAVQRRRIVLELTGSALRSGTGAGAARSWKPPGPAST